MKVNRITTLSFAILLLASGSAISADSSRVWPDNKVGQLLKELDDLQDSKKAGTLPWERKVHEIVLLGPEAVPDLIAALDATPEDDRLMLRSIPLIMRGIGDKRAIPALIRTIPRCYGADGSDMGYSSNDPELQRFFRKLDTNRDHWGTYSYGRPINEVFDTLKLWTGVSLDYQQLAFVWKDQQTPRQEYLKKKLYHECALRWATWWREHWREHVDDESLSEVTIPEFVETDPGPYQLERTRPLISGRQRSNMLINPYFEVKSERIFYDLDTGRWSGLPQKFRDYDADKLKSSMEAIRDWARTEGFDLMGSEANKGGQQYFTVESIDLEAWDITDMDWDPQQRLTSIAYIADGQPTERVLAYYDASRPAFAFDETATFFYITKEGTAGILSLGEESRDAKDFRGLGRKFELRKLSE